MESDSTVRFVLKDGEEIQRIGPHRKSTTTRPGSWSDMLSREDVSYRYPVIPAVAAAQSKADDG